MGHGNHWECLEKPVDDALKRFLPPALASGKVMKSLSRDGLWFDRKVPSRETVYSVIYGTAGLGVMALLVTDTPVKTSMLYSAFPYIRKGGKQRLRLSEIRDWGNEVEAVLVCENKDGAEIAFFDTHYFGNRDHYRVGEEYDFQIAGLVYSARCTNDETIEITSVDAIEKHAKAWGEEPERLPDGTLAPLVIHYAGCTGYAGFSQDYPEDAEFYCVIDKVKEFDLEGIRIFEITPKTGEESAPLPGRIFAAAPVLKHGYIPKRGDSIGGGLWTQGFLDRPTRPKAPKKNAS